MPSPKHIKGTGSISDIVKLLNDQLGDAAKISIDGPGKEVPLHFQITSTCNITSPDGAKKGCDFTIQISSL